MKRMAAGKFKAECLAVMDEVSQTGEAVLITKHGKPVAKAGGSRQPADDVFWIYGGKVKIVGDIVGPVTPLEGWELK